VVVLPHPKTPPSTTVRPDNAPKVRFFAMLGQEPEVEAVLAFRSGTRGDDRAHGLLLG